MTSRIGSKNFDSLECSDDLNFNLSFVTIVSAGAAQTYPSLAHIGLVKDVVLCGEEWLGGAR